MVVIWRSMRTHEVLEDQKGLSDHATTFAPSLNIPPFKRNSSKDNPDLFHGLN